MSELTEQGIAALKGGNREQAKKLLKAALQIDKKDIQAWMWMAAAVDTLVERRSCLEMVLKIDPQNQSAQKGLELLLNEAGQYGKSGDKDLNPASPTLIKTNPFIESQSDLPQETPESSTGVWVEESETVWKEDLLKTENQPVWDVSQFTGYKSGNGSAFVQNSEPEIDPPKKAVGQEQVETKIQIDEEILKKNSTPKAPVIDIGEELPDGPAQPQQKKTAGWKWRAGCGVALLGFITLIAAVFVYRDATRPFALPPTVDVAMLSAVSVTAAQTHTSTAFPTPTLTPTPRPTRTPTHTPTFVPHGPTVEAQMEDIQQQVSDLRGLPIQRTVVSYLVPVTEAERSLRESLVTDDLKASLRDQAIVLSMLGLVEPSYDLVENSLNHLLDSIGGYYEPWSQRVFVIGIRFHGIEHYVYSHEFDHALVDMRYPFEQLKPDEICTKDQQRCQAVTALIEGDAELLMNQWLKKYAPAQDIQELLNYRPPIQLLPESSPPPFAEQDLMFPYTHGRDFVEKLYAQGGWSAVNAAYQDPPITTEQILHTQKYTSREGPLDLQPPALEDVFDAKWRELDSNILGEWTTFLLLGYGANLPGQLDESSALKAAAGWGGDQYQVFYNEGSHETALAAEWVWDTTQDQVEFYDAFKYVLGKRFTVSDDDGENSTCWSGSSQVVCLYHRDRHTLWLMAPDAELLGKMKARFSQFQ